MGAIEEIYADLDADVSEERFREAVEQKVEQMEGLADEETAAMIIAHEIADNEVETISDIEPAMDEVKFLAKVLSIGELRTFERDEEDEDGRVINVEAADETGTVRLAFWDEKAAAISDGELDVGDVLRIKGRPKDGYNGLEVSVDEAEPDDEVEIDVSPGEDSTIDSLTLGQSDVTVRGLVLGTEEVRTFSRDDGSEGRVSNLTLGDETGRIRVTLWDDRADRAEQLESGTAVEIIDGYVREREGSLELHVGDRGEIDEIDEEVAFEPDATPIESAELDATIDIAGVVRSTDPKRTFDRDDGSEGQVRNVRVQDDTGDIRVALWGEKADLDIGPGDELFLADVEIQDGWQDDLEASAGWGSTVVVLEGATIDAGGPSAGEESGSGNRSGAVSDGGDSAGLDEFADGERPSSSDEQTSSGGGGTTEFTGTVVQTGNPVVLDDGTETMKVETNSHLQLGEEVTARGTLDGETLDADEIL
ncbi:single-stranded DNA binding protein [Halovenus sp. WSH3]|uniref:Single-stranded DNA binding protein n=1 Tax=Halovenus carboxidivorans TaxID=2692199 RepID=A0A6B0T072_9EURY|nr:single-stranded DNA binding protein [Halovenus carboxidivorans]MXR50627.1 single-stranded DNA binding protein [Halovenus carboxidivorans]